MLHQLPEQRLVVVAPAIADQTGMSTVSKGDRVQVVAGRVERR